MNTKRNILIFVCAVGAICVPPSAIADFTFGEPVKFWPVLGTESIDCLSYDGLELYFEATRPGGQGNWDLWVLKRASTDGVWGPAENLGPMVNGPNNDAMSSISADGLTLYFCSDRPYGDDARYNVFVTTRATKDAPWGQAVNAGPAINGPGGVNFGVWISPDNLELYVNSYRPGGITGSSPTDIYVARRATMNDPWTEAVNLGPIVNSPYSDALSCLSPDGLLLLFSEHWGATATRPGGYGGPDMWMARRANPSAPWQAPVNLGPKVNSRLMDAMPRVSPDGRTLYFASVRDGVWDNWQAPIIPIVDLNGDCQVDANDTACITSRLSTDDPRCDIGPMPWGDGVVDDRDLTALSEHIGEKIPDPTFVAQWALDEAGGDTARDSVGGHDGFVMGNPLWQPAGGQIGGAIQLDGVDDCIIAALDLNPAKGPFSVLAWVKGGAPGQVIISEPTCANWLMVDAEGRLMTRLASLSAGAGPLQSPAVITDGQWHRIRLVWDGSRRMLYVDEVAVAEDAQDALPSSGNGVYIGTDSNMTAGTFWSGLIDDVRVYTRAITEFAASPNPADGAKNVVAGVALSWTPGLKAVTHDVYFGPSNPPAFIGNQRMNTCNPGPLESRTTYYWRIDEIEADGTTVHRGKVWSFTTLATDIKKGPYLIYPGINTQMTVLWQLDAPRSHTLRWGRDATCSEGSTVPAAYGDNQYSHTITGLAPGAKYYYEVEDVGGGSFRAAPPDAAANVKFLAYGDTRSNPSTHDAVNAQMIATYTTNPAYQTFTLLTGDWVANGDLESDWMDQFFSRIEENTLEMQANLPINGCIGNHEQTGTVFKKYWPYPYQSGNWYWSFDYGPAHIAVVDLRRESDSLSQAQKAWLEADLAGSSREWKFLQFHAPVYSAGGSHANNNIEQAYIQSLCERYKVAIVFAGHNHYYARAMVNGVAHITAGGGGAPLYQPLPSQPNIVASEALNHFCKISIEGKRLTFEAVGVDGATIDTLTLSH